MRTILNRLVNVLISGFFFASAVLATIGASELVRSKTQEDHGRFNTLVWVAVGALSAGVFFHPRIKD